MLELVNPQVFENGTIETCCDPTMGTAGFLVSYLKRIKENALCQKIDLDWNFITDKGLFGKEIDDDPYQLASSNMLLSSGHVFNNFEHGDSIRQPIKEKFDIIMANPPFGIQGLKYDDFTSSIKFEYTPIKTDNAVSLFIQAIIYMLKIEGRCAIVLPDGKEVFSKTNKTLIQVREYLLKTCDLQEIIYLPSGIFTNTSIKTCIFYFIKKEEGSGVLTRIIKGNKITYNMCDEHATECVKFYQYDEKDDYKKLIVEVNIDSIIENFYSLDYNEYIEKEVVECNTDIEWMALGDVCKYEIGGTPSRNNEDYYDGNNLWVSVKELHNNIINTTKETLSDLGVSKSSVKLLPKDTVLFSFKLSIGKTAIAGVPLYTNEAIVGLNPLNNEQLNYKYLYYYLTVMDFSNMGTGMLGNGSMNKTSLSELQIPIPSINQQKEVVEYLDFLYESIKTSEKMIKDYKKSNEFYIKHNTRGDDTEIKKLIEMCEYIPKKNKYQASDGHKSGMYNFYTSGSKIMFRDDIEFKNLSIIIGRGGNSCLYLDKNFTISHDDIYVISCNDTLLLTYIYKYLYANFNIISELLTGSTIKHLSKEKISNIEIPVPSLRTQRQIVSYCDNNNNDIMKLTKKINDNKKLIKSYLDNIIYGKQDDQLVVASDMTHDEKITTLCQILRENKDAKIIDYYNCFK